MSETKTVTESKIIFMKPLQDDEWHSKQEISSSITDFIRENPEMNNFFILYYLVKDWLCEKDDCHSVIIPAMCESKWPFVEYDKWWEPFCGKQEKYTLEEAREMFKKGIQKYLLLFPFKFLEKEEWNSLNEDQKYEEALDRIGFMMEWNLTNGNCEPLFEKDYEKCGHLGGIMLEILNERYN